MARTRRAVAAAVLTVCLQAIAAAGQESSMLATFDRVAETITALEHCQDVAQIDFSNAQVTHNNLGGRGPDSGEPVIKYVGAGKTADGTSIDIVVSNRSAYTTDGNGAKQGLAVGGRMGELNVAAASRVDLRFSFVRGGTGEHISLNNVILTFLALGSERAQSLTACGHNAYFLSDRPAEQPGGVGGAAPPSEVEVLADRPRLFCTTFESMPTPQPGASVTEGLGDPTVLTRAQQAKSLSLQYHGVSFVDLELAVGGRPSRGTQPGGDVAPSSFLFAGPTPIDGCAPVGTSTSTSTSTNTLSSTSTSTFTTTWTSTTTTSITSTTTSTSTTTPPPLHLWNCANDEVEAWPASKKAWCCEREQLGCTPEILTDGPEAGETQDLHNCYSGYSNWQTAWSESKKAWCCQAHQMGCEPYHCEDNLADMMVGWSSAKKDWCCANRGVCQPVQDGPLARMDCSGSEFATWTAERRTWCCAHEHVGCAVRPYDCSQGIRNWEQDWSAGKKIWCWEHEQRGFAEPYDCGVQVETWEQDWLGEKKAWCCQHKRLGCGFDCTFGGAAQWPDVKTRWCCKERAVGCERLPARGGPMAFGQAYDASSSKPWRQAVPRSAAALALGGLVSAALAAAAALVVRRSRSQSYRAVAPLADGPAATGGRTELIDSKSREEATRPEALSGPS